MNTPYAIGVISQKGGPGKSTIARALGTAYALAGWSVKIIDLDLKQATATNWQKRRLAAGITPDVPVQLFANVATAMARSGDADLLIFDGTPSASDETTRIAQQCQMIILPTGLSYDDLDPAIALANSLTDKHAIPAERMAFAFSQTTTSAAQLASAQTYLGKTRFAYLDGTIRHMTSYSDAMDLGLSVIETPSRGPRTKALEVIQSAISRFEALTKD